MFVCLYADGYQVGFISFFAHMIVYHVNKYVQFKTVGKQVYDEVIEYHPLSCHLMHTYLSFWVVKLTNPMTSTLIYLIHEGCRKTSYSSIGDVCYQNFEVFLFCIMIS